LDVMVARPSKLQLLAQPASALALFGMCAAAWQGHRLSFNVLAVPALAGAFFGRAFQSCSAWHWIAISALYAPSFVVLLLAEFGWLNSIIVAVARGALVLAVAVLLGLQVLRRSEIPVAPSAS
jgi:hypothetical protein